MEIRDNIINRLWLALHKSKKSKLNRLIAQPWCMIYPKLIKALRFHNRVKAKTFWDDEMEVCLPEPISSHIWRYGYFDADVCLFMLHSLHKGMTFLDIGAHFGFFSLLGSYLVGREGKVLSFEPTPETYTQLERNIFNYCKYKNIQAFNYAILSADSQIKFFNFGFEDSAYNSVFGLRKKGVVQKAQNQISVKTRSIDSFLEENKFRNIGLVKIDAESSEMQVLKGMEITIKTFAPKIIIEAGDFGIEGSPDSCELVHWLRCLGYYPFEFTTYKITPHVPKEKYNYCNLLFVSKE